MKSFHRQLAALGLVATLCMTTGCAGQTAEESSSSAPSSQSTTQEYFLKTDG